MNDSTANGVCQHDLDRLVDGELSSADRRRVLAALAAESDGWQRCALAFLEVQSWRKACRGIVATEPLTVAVARGPHRTHAPLVRTLVGLSVAAAVLVAAFVSGRVVGRAERVVDTPQVESGLAANQEQPAADQVKGPEQDVPVAGMAKDAAMYLVGVVNFDGANGSQQAVPIVAAAGLDEHWLRSRPPVMTDYERHQWARRGWQVKEQRKVITVQLIDGRQLSIPLDLVSLNFQRQGVF